MLHKTDRIEFLNSILESSTEYSIVAKDLNATIRAWNEGARRVYGYDPQDVIGKVSAFILHDADDVTSGRAQAILDQARTTGKWEGELKRVRKNGTRFTAHVTMTLRRDAEGAPIGFTMISRDLTHSQQIERELRESQEYTRSLIESNIDALMTTDPLGIITDVNRQMCEMTATRADAAAFAVSDVVPKLLLASELLPALERPGVPAEQARAVMVVDNNLTMMRLASAVLSHHGYRVHCHDSALLALAAVAHDPPAAILLDLVMPGMDGFEFLDRLRSTPAGRKIPVIVWTVKDLTTSGTDKLRAAVQAVVLKKTGLHELVEALEAWMPAPVRR